MAQRLKTAVLISGRGSNMQALVKAAQAPDYPAEIVLIGSNKADAAGLEFAKEMGLATFVLSHKEYSTREDYDHAMDAALRVHGIEFICLAGFMRLLTPWFCEQWQGRMINIHPSLLPDFKGLHTHERALEAGASEHGCTVHWVSAGMDEGEIIAQALVPVLAEDTPETLGARVLEQEHGLYVQALRDVAQRHIDNL